jgi:hypothetical protein
MQPADPRRLEALRWRAVERGLRAQGWSRKDAMREVARRKVLEREKPSGLFARLLERFR